MARRPRLAAHRKLTLSNPVTPNNERNCHHAVFNVPELRARVSPPAIQSVESIPHELPFFQKRYDYFGNGLLCGFLYGLLFGFLRLTLRTYRELLELVSRDQ